MSKVTPLPDTDHVVRNVPWSKLRRDEDDNVLGFNPDAFQLRPDENSDNGWETSLSLNWLEFFQDPDTRLRDCVWAMRKTRKVGTKSRYAIANVLKIKEICAARDVKVRIVHEPRDEDKSHSGIRRLPPEDMKLFAALAEEAFTGMICEIDIPKQHDSTRA